MNAKEITFKELDALIDEYKEDVPQKKALLILKSGCTPYRGTAIPKRTAIRVVNSAKTSSDHLALGFADDDDEPMFEFHDSIGKGLGKVIQLCFVPEEE